MFSTDYEKYHGIPELLRDSLIRYGRDKIPPGGFLRAILENDLFEAMGRADLENRLNIFHICDYIYNELPSTCWGDKEKVAKWLGE
jgi:hypothetical protein